ncbi:hypothetical protein F5B17DRAFT_410833 [Nemania serpens]|nr:hypothetical protein F5B17DRAFT_410833 [Nemania serpens]
MNTRLRLASFLCLWRLSGHIQRYHPFQERSVSLTWPLPNLYIAMVDRWEAKDSSDTGWHFYYYTRSELFYAYRGMCTGTFKFLHMKISILPGPSTLRA